MPVSTTSPRSSTTTMSAYGKPARRCEHRTMVARCSGGAPGPERVPERGDDGRLGRDVDGRERDRRGRAAPGTCGAAAARARASPRRCRWPPEMRTPASPISVSRPCGNPATSSSRAASRIARRERRRRPRRPAGSNAMFCRSDPENNARVLRQIADEPAAPAGRQIGERLAVERAPCPRSTGYTPRIARASALFPDPDRARDGHQRPRPESRDSARGAPGRRLPGYWNVTFRRDSETAGPRPALCGRRSVGRLPPRGRPGTKPAEARRPPGARERAGVGAARRRRRRSGAN